MPTGVTDSFRTPIQYGPQNDNGAQRDVSPDSERGQSSPRASKSARRVALKNAGAADRSNIRKSPRPAPEGAESTSAKSLRKLNAVELQQKAEGEIDRDKTVFLQLALILIRVAQFIGEMLRGFGKNQLLGLEKARNWTGEANRMDKCWTDTPDTGSVAINSPDVQTVLDRLKEDRQSIGGRPVNEWLKDPANLLDGKLKKSAIKELAETCRNISTAYSDTSQTDQAQLQIDSGKITTLNTMAMGLIKEWKRLLQIIASP